MTVEPALPAEIDRLPDGFNVIITSQMHCAKRISWLRNATACYRGSTCMRQRDGFDRRVQWGRWLCAAASASIRFWPFSLTLIDPTFTPTNCLAPDVAKIFCRLLKKWLRKAQIAVNWKSHKDQLVIRMNTRVLFTLTVMFLSSMYTNVQIM